MNVYCPAFSFFCLDNSWMSRVKLKTVENRLCQIVTNENTCWKLYVSKIGCEP